MSVARRVWVLFGFLLFVGVAAVLVWYLFSPTRYTPFEIRTAEPVSDLIAARLDS